MPMPDDMKLPAGKACGDCAHHRRCDALFGCKATNTTCDWSPHRFRQRVPTIAIAADKPWSFYP